MTPDPLTPLEAALLATCIATGQDAWAIHQARKALAKAHRTGVGIVDAEHNLDEAMRRAADRRRDADHAVEVAA